MSEDIPSYEEERQTSHLGEEIRDHTREELTVYKVTEINDEGTAGGEGHRGWQLDVRCGHTGGEEEDRTTIYTRSEILMKEWKKVPAIAERIRKSQPFRSTVYSEKNFFLPYPPKR